jgi:anti-anti-sigma factor
LEEYTFTSAGKLRRLENDDTRADPHICILQAEGGLFFGSVDLFHTQLHRLASDGPLHVIILQMMNVRYLDASVCIALIQLNGALQKMGCHLLLSGVTPEVEKILASAGVNEALGNQKIFSAIHEEPSRPTRAAYSFAKGLISR